MRDKPVHTRSDVDVRLRTFLEYFPCGPQILMEVMSFGVTGTVVAIGQDRESFGETKAETGDRVEFLVREPVRHEPGHLGDTREQCSRTESRDVALLLAKGANTRSP